MVQSNTKGSNVFLSVYSLLAIQVLLLPSALQAPTVSGERKVKTCNIMMLKFNRSCHGTRQPPSFLHTSRYNRPQLPSAEGSTAARSSFTRHHHCTARIPLRHSRSVVEWNNWQLKLAIEISSFGSFSSFPCNNPLKCSALHASMPQHQTPTTCCNNLHHDLSR